MNWNIKPFHGVRYNTEKLGGIEDVIAPPYDVISPAQRDQLYDKHECNIVHLTLGKDQEGDTERNNRYTRAGRLFSEWEQAECLQQDDQPAFYVYDQTFTVASTEYTRRAFFSALKLEPFGKRVLPHEETMPGPKADRMSLLTACPVNLSPIFGLYPDPDNAIAATLNAALGEPEVCFEDFTGIRQTLWKITQPDVLEKISQLMDDKPIYIADGHHRYETALGYRDRAIEQEGQLASDDPRNYVMAACVSLNDPGLVVLPAHRLVGNVPGFSFDSFLEKLASDFTLEAIDLSGSKAEAIVDDIAGKHHTFGLYSEGRAYRATLKDETIADANPLPRSLPWKRLDVSLLVWLIFEKNLGITHDDLSNSQRVAYVKDDAEAAQLIDDGSYQMACYLNSTRLDQLEAVAQAGDRMPPKSTYFYPKLLTGMVMRKIVD